ncbi:Na+/H+ antiporter NhaA [Ruegeria lacuscaerulensis]|uniref:Na+/H+ antiporter NhaA n=1 Tax=Ruegeria lacuscaerulensis TaxID=55218 RepID=UPI003013B97D
MHPALGLLPIIPAIPHADRDFGIFSEEEAHKHDLLNEMEHRLKVPVEVVLLLFGLANARVEFSAIGEATLLVLLGLLLGKPIGILLMGWLAAIPLGFGLPAGMRVADLFILGCVAAIGFMVSLFVATVAFEAGAVQNAAKMGALLSIGAAGIAILAGRVLKVEKRDQPVDAYSLDNTSETDGDTVVSR